MEKKFYINYKMVCEYCMPIVALDEEDAIDKFKTLVDHDSEEIENCNYFVQGYIEDYDVEEVK